MGRPKRDKRKRISFVPVEEEKPPRAQTILPWDPHKYEYDKMVSARRRTRITHEFTQLQKKVFTDYEELYCQTTGLPDHVRQYPRKRKTLQWPIDPKLIDLSTFQQKAHSTATTTTGSDLIEPICDLIEKNTKDYQSVEKWTVLAKSIEKEAEMMMQTILTDGAKALQGELQVKPDSFQQLEEGAKPVGNWKFIMERIVEKDKLQLTAETKERIKKRFHILFPKVL